MELAEHGDMQHCYRWDFNEMLNAIKQILKGLIYLHEDTRIVHRDIKPQNIIVMSRGPIHVKICDFGLALPIKPKMTYGLSTPDYMPPELYVEGHTYTENVDVWALGAILLSSSLFGGLERKSSLFDGELLVPEHRNYEIIDHAGKPDSDLRRIWAESLQELSQAARPGWRPLKNLAKYMATARASKRPSARQALTRIPSKISHLSLFNH